MEKAVLTIILIAAVAILARIVWRSVSRAVDPSKPPACEQCPFDSKCEMQNRPHAETCGVDGNETGGTGE